MTKLLPNAPLDPIKTDEFLPPVNRWVTFGSCFIVLALGGAIAASFFVNYRTAVKAQAVVRPVGEPRVIQAQAAGKVVKILAQNNQPVARGEVIAQLDTASAEARAIQLLANLDQGKNRLAQVRAQLATIDRQIAAETAQAERTIAAATADFSQAQRDNQDKGIAAQASVLEAQAQIELAEKEAESYRQLVDSGAVSRLQLTEKQAALAAAQARMIRLQAALNPSTGDVRAARERIAQSRASGLSTLAGLQQQKQQLVSQGIEIQEQLQTTEQEIAQVNLELDNSVVRSPVSGVLHELSLRNTGQVLNPGETIAKVIPDSAPVELKAMVPAPEINKVTVGLPAQMRVSACPYTEFGTVAGKVKSVSPDTVTAPVSNRTEASTAVPTGAFYSVIIETQTPELASETLQESCSLLPGTQGEVTIISRKETVITFLRRKMGLMTSF